MLWLMHTMNLRRRSTLKSLDSYSPLASLLYLKRTPPLLSLAQALWLTLTRKILSMLIRTQ